MTLDALRRVLTPRAATAQQWLPVSGLVGLALPVALLGAVFLGMGLNGPSLLAWTVATGLIAVALAPVPALAVTLTMALSALVLLQLMSGVGPALSNFELATFALVSILAGTVGQLLAVLLRERAQLISSRSSLDVFERVFSSLFESSRDCVKLIAADGTILAVNQAGLALAGARQDSEMVGCNWFGLWDRDMQKTMEIAWQGAFSRGEGEFTGNCRTFSGERRIWQNHFTALQLQPGAQPCVLCVSRDITDSLAAQQTLKARLAQLGSLASNVDDAFCAIASNWTVAYANARAEQLLGDGAETLVGRSFWDFFHPSREEEGALCIRRAMEQQNTQSCEYFCAQRQSWLRVTAFSHAAGVGVLLRDMTPAKVAEKHAAEENTRLQVAQEIAGFGDWSFDYDQGQMKLSPRAVTLLGLVECPPHEHKKQLLERLHPQDRMALVQAIINSSSESPRLDLTVRMPAADASGDLHIHWIGQLISDQRGQPLRMMGAVQDVTAHLNAQQAVEKAQMLVRNIVDVLPLGVGVFDRNGNFVIENRAYRKLREELYGAAPVSDSVFDQEQKPTIQLTALSDEFRPMIRDLFAGTAERFEREYHLTVNGQRRSLMLHMQRLDSSSGELVLLTHSDISSLVQLTEATAQNEKQMRDLLENLPDIFWIYDLQQKRFTYFSSAAEKLTGLPRENLLDGAAWASHVHPDDIPVMRERTEARKVGEADATEVQYRFFDGDGELHWLDSRAVSMRDEHNEVARLIGITRDITENRGYQQQLLTAAYVDDITGLPNRKALLQEMTALIDQPAAPFALLLLNLDRFKNINDTLGHGSGDLLLQQTGERLRALLGDDCYLARFGSDEFALICPDARRNEISADVQRSFGEAFDLYAERIFVTASIGAASYPRDSSDGGQLLRYAGVAVQRAKILGRNNFQVFQDTMMLPTRERLALENELRTALQNSEFELFYQGKFNLLGGALIGAEALLRWRSPSRGLVSPIDFIPLLEETGLIVPVGEWVLAQACRQVRAWHDGSGHWLPVAVNVSALQVVNRSFGENAVSILRESGVPNGVIELEITESALMTDAAHGGQLINTLKAAGFSIALDDFGTGYSNLSYLRRFAPNTLKIDRSFVAELTSHNSDRAIIEVVLQLAKALHIDVVAEGIELIEQREILCEMACRYGQGYLFCKPLPVAEFEQQVMAKSQAQVA